MSNFDTPTPEKVPQPTGYRILVRPLPAVEKTKGGIILTDRNKEDQAYLNSVGHVILIERSLGVKLMIGLSLGVTLVQKSLYKKSKW